MPKLPRDLFMIMRVITLLRGVLASMCVYHVSSALLWRPMALQVTMEKRCEKGCRLCNESRESCVCYVLVMVRVFCIYVYYVYMYYIV